MKHIKLVFTVALAFGLMLLLPLHIHAADALPGDLNNDGIVNTTDVVYLRRYIAGGYGIELTPPSTECNHEEITDPAVSPTCTTTGLTAGKHCGKCGEILLAQQTVPTLSHTYLNGTCSVCGKPAPVANRYTYTVNADGRGCTITGIESGTETILSIPTRIDGYAVTAIDNGAFSGCTHLTSVTLNNGIVSIGSRAFYGCTSLTEATIPATVTKIGTNVFQKCDSLKTVYCYTPGWDEFMGETMLFGCAALEKVVLRGSNLHGTLCRDMTNIKEVVIEGNITSIGFHRFDGCTSLESVTMSNKVTLIDSDAFANCVSLSHITLSDRLTEISLRAFNNCTSLKSISLPQTLTTLGRYVFNGCTALDEITIPDNVHNMGEYAFAGCTRLAKVTLGKNVTGIDRAAFSGCTSLTEINLPDSVGYIGESAFSGCTSLRTVTFSDSIMRIDAAAFGNCRSLSSISFRGTKADWQAIPKAEGWDSGMGTYTVHCTDGDL